MEEQTCHDNKVARLEDIRACCGFHCSQCPAYIGNIRSEEDRNRVSEAWKKIYGLDIPVEAIKCDGCLKPDSENPHRIGGACEMRTCVQSRNIPHCGFCDEFPCDLIECHLTSVETVAPGCRNTLAPDEFKDFIEPYLCREYLERSNQ
ncbi:MAG TPA: DUF3795 domain-containing protein [Methanospirillum sp.]|uniref:DUF3795 domain-containing protein n=1 Tax=Methanospirillum sp. TaxID=45200 RepID=UPI002BC2D7AD|nr:DUF3795 domain-containing protein [Methanospirillum sp.]HWQ63475.1 DUF3795 domain-containing protein [Methanospirillum sp.]